MKTRNEDKNALGHSLELAIGTANRRNHGPDIEDDREPGGDDLHPHARHALQTTCITSTTLGYSTQEQTHLIDQNRARRLATGFASQDSDVLPVSEHHGEIEGGKEESEVEK